MATFRNRVLQTLQKEFIEGTVYRVDMDRVDVAPDGSSGILRSLPLTGDRDKIKPGDAVRIITVNGERIALAADVSSETLGEEVLSETAPVEGTSGKVEGDVFMLPEHEHAAAEVIVDTSNLYPTEGLLGPIQDTVQKALERLAQPFSSLSPTVTAGYGDVHAGVSIYGSRADHEHTVLVNYGTPSSISNQASPGTGGDGKLSLGSHVHNYAFTDGEGDPTIVDGTAAADGTSTWPARRDHRHQIGSHTHIGADILTGTVAAARLGSGTPSAANFLRGDGAWATVTAVAAPHTHPGADIVSGTVPAARLGTGTPSVNTFLRGDGYWATSDSSFVPIEGISTGYFTGVAGTWVRIAKSDIDIARFSGLISVEWGLAGRHGTLLMYVACMYGQYPIINIISSTGFLVGNEVFNQVRLIYNTTYTGNYAYIELFNPAVSASIGMTVKLINTSFMSISDPNVASPGIPAGSLAVVTPIPFGGGSVRLGYGTIEDYSFANTIYQKANQPRFLQAGGMMFPMTNQDLDGPVGSFMPSLFTTRGHVGWPGGVAKLLDTTGAANHFTLTNVSANRSWGNTQFAGGHADFNGTNALATSPAMGFGNGGNWQGGGMWVYLDAIGRNHSFLQWGTTTPSWGVINNTGNQFNLFYYRSDNAAMVQVLSSNLMTLGWNFIGWRFYYTDAGSNQISIYLNGTWTSQAMQAPARTAVGNITVGYSSVAGAYFDGMLGPAMFGVWQDVVNVERMYHTQRIYFDR